MNNILRGIIASYILDTDKNIDKIQRLAYDKALKGDLSFNRYTMFVEYLISKFKLDRDNMYTLFNKYLKYTPDEQYITTLEKEYDKKAKDILHSSRHLYQKLHYEEYSSEEKKKIAEQRIQRKLDSSTAKVYIEDNKLIIDKIEKDYAYYFLGEKYTPTKLKVHIVSYRYGIATYYFTLKNSEGVQIESDGYILIRHKPNDIRAYIQMEVDCSYFIESYLS